MIRVSSAARAREARGRGCAWGASPLRHSFSIRRRRPGRNGEFRMMPPGSRHDGRMRTRDVALGEREGPGGG